ncbi:hypothetical protein AVEN_191150-1 [Araneus ventricosus]|uniref:Uncharacterized protein n=1 Tax=Araneus ventricosus TaxID=182803 RepID=A0A4Y2B043_ARAVE|nr:hypothetical protein AVEN_191150-1 [Araneus ventricosus]
MKNDIQQSVHPIFRGSLRIPFAGVHTKGETLSQGSIKRAELAAIVRQSASAVIWSNEKRNLPSWMSPLPQGERPRFHQRVSAARRPQQIVPPLPYQNMTLSTRIDCCIRFLFDTLLRKVECFQISYEIKRI